MSLGELIKRPLQRLNPFRGLVLDAPAWNTAHEYHRRQQQLHSLGMHTAGVVTGLEVAAWDPPDNSVVVYPGMALDPEGNAVLVGQPERFYFDAKTPGAAYLILRLRNIPQQMVQPPGGEQPQPRYFLEGYTLEESREAPEGAYVELARVRLSGSGAGVSDAASPHDPGLDEIDTRFRRQSGPRPHGTVAIGVAALERDEDGTARHWAGAAALARAINGTTHYRAEFLGEVALDQEALACQLLVIAGQQELALTETQEEVLRTFLARGGTLLGEACGAGTTARSREVMPLPFQQSFGRLADRLDASLRPVERGHELLTALHRFSQPPEGPDGARLLLAGDGLLYSEADYGCLWNGGRPDGPAGREAVRSAIELGTNLGIFSSRRFHQQSIRMRSS
jgi:hypothetical protein